MRVSMLALPLALITCEPQDGYVQRPEPKPLFGSSREAERQMAEARPAPSATVRPVAPPAETPPPVATVRPVPPPAADPAPPPVAAPSPTLTPPVIVTAPAATPAPVAPSSSLPAVMPPAVSRPPLETQRGTALAPSLPAAAPASTPGDDAPRMLLLPTSGGETPACQAGLKARGLKDNELWVMMREPAAICPGNGVSAARIRAIAGFWVEAGCTKHPPEEILRALNANRCR